MLRRSSLRANNRSLRSIIHQFIKFPLLRRPMFSNIPFWVAWWVCFFSESVALVTGVTANNRFHRSIVHLSLRTQRTLTFSSGFPRFSDAVDDRADGALSLLRAINFIIGLDFAVTLSSPDSSCVLFDITTEQSVELEVACERDEGIKFHTRVPEVLHWIYEFGPVDHAVALPKTETKHPSDRLSLLWSVFSPRKTNERLVAQKKSQESGRRR